MDPRARHKRTIESCRQSSDAEGSLGIKHEARTHPLAYLSDTRTFLKGSPD